MQNVCSDWLINPFIKLSRPTQHSTAPVQPKGTRTCSLQAVTKSVSEHTERAYCTSHATHGVMGEIPPRRTSTRVKPRPLAGKQAQVAAGDRGTRVRGYGKKKQHMGEHEVQIHAAIFLPEAPSIRWQKCLQSPLLRDTTGLGDLHKVTD